MTASSPGLELRTARFREAGPIEFATVGPPWLGGDGHPMIDKAVRVNEILEIIGDVLSSMSLAFAVAIFCCYSSLSSVRNKIHRNLFIAMLMQILAHLLLASREIATSRTKVQAAKLEFLQCLNV
uniref:G protein-coupled receptor n=1 Tax=Macrostomum lignano TaxID=282301 RepID=A0A1I8FNI6_9PLAT